MLGKTFDTFAPLGPAIVTRDAVPDVHSLGMSCGRRWMVLLALWMPLYDPMHDDDVSLCIVAIVDRDTRCVEWKHRSR